MKIIITENKKKDAIYKYFDKIKAGGELPSIGPFLDMFGVDFSDNKEYYNLIVDYYGGFDNAVELAKKIALELKEVPFQSNIGDGTLYFAITKVDLEHDELVFEVNCYGELFNVEIYDEDEDDYEIVDRISLSDYYFSWESIGESDDILEQIDEEIHDILVKEITYKTGVELHVDEIEF